MSRPANVEVFLRNGESVEKLIRRFFKKVKKTDIIKESLEKTAHARSKSQKRRDKILKNRHLRKVDQKRQERRLDRRQNNKKQ